MAAPRILTIPPGTPFLPTLVEALLSGRLVEGVHREDPLALADAVLYLPTRRAARAVADVFLDVMGGRATVLPRIRALGDIDDDEAAVSESAAGIFGAESGVAPALTPLERRLALARLAMEWRRTLPLYLPDRRGGPPIQVPASPADAVRMAGDLADLIDAMAAQERPWDGLAALVPDDHAEHWRLTVEFLKIIAEHWPRFLSEEQALDPAARQVRLLEREAERLRERPNRAVIAAGATGSIPATIRLLQAIAAAPRGAVVLPGLDVDLDAQAWDAIGGPEDGRAAPGHPQYVLKQLLRALGRNREAVEPLGERPSPALARRCRLVNEALRPAETTEAWRDIPERFQRADVADAFADVGLLVAANEREEALAVAFALREALEQPGATAALVTPDRGRARRVAAELQRFGLVVDDSAGVPLSATPPGIFARLVAEAALFGLEPVTLLALLKHPLTALGKNPAAARAAARTLELAVLRGPRPRPGSAGLLAALAEAHRRAEERRPSGPRGRLSAQDWRAAFGLAEAVAAALAPLERFLQEEARGQPLAALVRAHWQAMMDVAADETGAAALLAREAGEELANAFQSLAEATRRERLAFDIAPRDYPATFLALIGDIVVRRRVPPQGRVFVWGPLEARLQHVDFVVLSGLEEGVWPAVARTDAFLSRPMRAALGLEAPERRIGLSAHDFAQLAGAPRVLFSRSEKVGGAPTVASRWLQRLEAVVGADGAKRLRGNARRFLDWARAVDRSPAAPLAAPRPEPKPPLAARPTRLSVTEIETWIRDPYAVYARRVLKLERLDEIGAAPDRADRGTLVHDMLAKFIAGEPPGFDDAAAAACERLAEEALAVYAAFPELVALWRPRLSRIARWLVMAEASRTDVVRRHVERKGALQIGENFTLTCRADRLDEFADGTLAVLDYKTGAPPTKKQVASLLAPQLALEAAIAMQGGFEGVPARPVSELAYIRLSGGPVAGEWEPRGERTKDHPDLSPEKLAEAAFGRLNALVLAYADPNKGYLSRARVAFESDIAGDYDHLARAAEWGFAHGATP